MLTPIIVPLGTVQIPLHSQEPNPGYHQYQLHSQYQVPDMQQLPLSDPRGLNHIPPGVLPPELRNLPHNQLNMEMRPPRISPEYQLSPEYRMPPQNNQIRSQVGLNLILSLYRDRLISEETSTRNYLIAKLFVQNCPTHLQFSCRPCL